MIWKTVNNYEGKYEVSDNGSIKSLLTNKIMTLQDNGKGYKYVQLNSPRVKFYVHRLVASAFTPNITGLPQVNHINGNKADNNVSNLEWCNNSQNQKHAHKTGLKVSASLFGDRNGRFTDGQRCISTEVKICPECNAAFSGKSRESVFCSKACSNKSNARKMNTRMSTLRSERFANNYGRT